MPFAIKPNGPYLLIELFGMITRLEMHALAEEVSAIEQSSSVVPDRITDLRRVEGRDLNFADVHTFATLRKQGPLPNKVRSAIVVTSQVGKGFARMYQTLNDRPEMEIRLFTTFESAEEWLSKKKTPHHGAGPPPPTNTSPKEGRHTA